MTFEQKYFKWPRPTKYQSFFLLFFCFTCLTLFLFAENSSQNLNPPLSLSTPHSSSLSSLLTSVLCEICTGRRRAWAVCINQPPSSLASHPPGATRRRMSAAAQAQALLLTTTIVSKLALSRRRQDVFSKYLLLRWLVACLYFHSCFSSATVIHNLHIVRSNVVAMDLLWFSLWCE